MFKFQSSEKHIALKTITNKGIYIYLYRKTDFIDI